jgi:CelD/BcsL family acetyltransferase involved in cellulose biosynthesis
MHVDVIDDPATLLRLRASWEAVYGRDPDAQVFLSWTWIARWLTALDSNWVVLAAKETPEASEHLGFFPLQLRVLSRPDGSCFNELRTAGGPFAGYNGFLAVPERDAEIIPAFAAAVKRLHWAGIKLENLCVSPQRLRLFLDAFQPPVFRQSKMRRPDDGDGVDHDIYVYVDLPDDFETFLDQRLGAATRKNARRALRRLDGSPDLSVQATTPETFPDDLATLLRFWEAQWGPTLAARYGPAAPKGMMTNFRVMLGACMDGGLLSMRVLRRDGRPIGVTANLVDAKNRSLVSFVSGRDRSVHRPSPIFTLDLVNIREAIAEGFRTYDLQTGDFAYKYDLGGVEKRIEWLLVGTETRRNLGEVVEPRTLPLVLQQARSLHRQGRLEHAARVCRQILEVDRQCDEARELLARCTLPAPGVLNLAQATRPGGLTLDEQIRRALQKR